MRRVAIPIAALALAVGVWEATRSTERPHFRVAALFDTARGMVPGQQVKVAGAVVGKVEKVELAPGRKARMVLRVDRRFEPFHADAGCRILPEGLISENYVDCDPGTRGRAALPRRDGLPTVALEHTTVPVSLQDVINVFSLPVAQRVQMLLNELGLATAGRGEDLNAILRRANPALSRSRRVLAIIDGQRRQLAAAVGQTDRVLADLARRDDDVNAFVDRAATVSRTAADNRVALGESVRRLPALLDAARPGLRSIDRALAKASPLLDSLRASGPGLEKLTRTLPSFSEAGVPALRSVASAARRGRPAVRAARPVASRLRQASASARPFARNLNQLLVSTRDQGGFEGLLNTIYSFAAGSAAYDEVSHLAAFGINFFPQCFGGSGRPGCSHKYDAPGAGTIPINLPSCGPQPGAPWDPPTRCRTGPATNNAGPARDRPAEGERDPSAPAPARDRAGSRAAPRSAPSPRRNEGGGPPPGSGKLGPLLDYLLGP